MLDSPDKFHDENIEKTPEKRVNRVDPNNKEFVNGDEMIYWDGEFAVFKTSKDFTTSGIKFNVPNILLSGKDKEFNVPPRTFTQNLYFVRNRIKKDWAGWFSIGEIESEKDLLTNSNLPDELKKSILKDANIQD